MSAGSRPRVLTIAGTDPTGGAGVAADLKTFAAHGAYGMAVVTALVAQNTRGVRSVYDPPVQVLAAQLDAVSDDVTIDAVKIGLVGSAAYARAIGAWLDRVRPPHVVLDPVLGASAAGRPLLGRGERADDALAALRDLAARADVVTPNLAELAALAGVPVPASVTAMVETARTLAADLDTRVLVTGGHLGGRRSPDTLVAPSGAVVTVDGERVETAHTHGTGCALSSALAALRPVRPSWESALRDAKTWLAGALRDGGRLDVGRGPGPVDHLHGIPVRQRGTQPAHLLVLGGRSGVGKSSVAFALHDLLSAEGVRHAVVEGDALDLAWPVPWQHRVAERNLADVWRRYRELGHDRLVYTNTVSVLEANALAAAVGPGTRVTAVLLTSDDATARERLARRERGASLAAHVERSDAASRRLDAEAPSGVHRVVTDGRDVDDVAREVRDLWLGDRTPSAPTPAPDRRPA
jgi:hydroxymethylpyrimidine kinase/phosphomethylpyrimidine kinase